jgi:hypothetical protein
MATRIACLALASALAAAVVPAQEARPGDKPYTPTRLEWLEVTLNAEYSAGLSDDQYTVGFIAEADGRTIRLFVSYDPKVDRELLNHVVDTAKGTIMDTARGLKWDWVQVKEDVTMRKQKSK